MTIYGVVKIADMGVAIRTNIYSPVFKPPSYLAGTKMFMAPELYNGEEITHVEKRKYTHKLTFTCADV